MPCAMVRCAATLQNDNTHRHLYESCRIRATADLAAHAAGFFYACYGVIGNEGTGLCPKSTVATRHDVV